MQTMNSKEAAEYLGVHVNTLRKWVHKEGLPVLKFPGRTKMIFRKDLVDDWVYRRSQPDVYVNNERQDQDNSYGRLRVLSP